MTRHQIAILVSSAYNAFGIEPRVHELFIEHGVIDLKSCELWSLRRFERLPKGSLCVILCDAVVVAQESHNAVVSRYAYDIERALFSVDPPFKGGFDSLLFSKSTPLPVMGLFSSLIAATNPGNPVTSIKWLDLQYKWCELDL